MYDDGRHLWKHWMWFYLSMLRDNKKKSWVLWSLIQKSPNHFLATDSHGIPTDKISRMRWSNWPAPPHKSIPVPLKTSSGETWLQDYEVHEAQVKYSMSKGHSIALLKVLGSFCWTLVGHKAFLVKFCRSWAILFDFWKAYDHSLGHL